MNVNDTETIGDVIKRLTAEMLNKRPYQIPMNFISADERPINPPDNEEL